MIITKELHIVTPELENFLKTCEAKGFNNNSTLEDMKFDWCLEQGGMWYATYVDDRMVSVSGIHPWANGWRALFRGVQTESKKIGQNRHHMQSYCFHSQLPYQIDYASSKEKDLNNLFIYITTNTEHDASGKMNRIDKTFYHLEKIDLVKNLGVSEIFSVNQNTWILNVEKYNEIRRQYN